MKLPTKHHIHMSARRIESQKETALRLLGEHGLMRTSELKAAGVHYQTMARMREEGVVLRTGRGLYRLPAMEYCQYITFAEVAKTMPKGTICLISALQFHELTLQIPPFVWVAIGRKDRMPRISHPPVRAIRFGDKAMSAGVERHVLNKIETPIFDPAKTIVDCFRYRKRIGIDIALEGLRNGVRERKAHPDQIVSHARNLNIWSVLRPYLDATLADEG